MWRLTCCWWQTLRGLSWQLSSGLVSSSSLTRVQHLVSASGAASQGYRAHACRGTLCRQRSYTGTTGSRDCQNIAPSRFRMFVIFPFPLPQPPKTSHYWTAPSGISASEVGVRAWHSLHWWLGLALRLVLVTILQRRTSTTGHLAASTPTKLDSSWSAPPLKVNIVFCFLMVTWSGPGLGHFSTLSVLHSGWSSSMSWYSMWKPHLVS